MTKLPIRWAVQNAYSVTFKNLGTASRLAVLPLVALLAVELVLWLLVFYQWEPGAKSVMGDLGSGGLRQSAPSEAVGTLGMVAANIIIVLFGAIFAVSWFRFILLGRRDTTFPVQIKFGVKEVKCIIVFLWFACTIIILTAVISMLLWLCLLIMTPIIWEWIDETLSIVTKVIQFCAFNAWVVFVFRYSFVFPAFAVDQYKGFPKARLQLKGSTWRLFWSSVVVTLPIFVIGILVQRAFFETSDLPDLLLGTFDMLELSKGRLALYLAIAVVLRFSILTVIISLWASAYQKLAMQDE